MKMKPSMILKLAASGLVLTFTAAGCTGTGTGTGRVASASQNPEAKPEIAAKAAAKARELLATDKARRAFPQAELAVAHDGRNAAYRTLLGQSYMAAGRFSSAIAAFDDARTLGANDAATVIGLALANIAVGKEREAAELITANSDVLPASDAGLALALAGDAQRSLYVLTEAARQPEADARTRQNLAFALAMAGKWAQAQIIAAQDLSPDKVEPRMAEWAKLAQQTDSRMRVASLIGVTPVVDGGMPVRLALVAPDASVQLAAAAPMVDPAPIAEYAPPPPAAEAEQAVVFAAAEQPAIRSIELPMPTTPAKAAEAQIILADQAPYRAAPVERPAMAEARTLAARVNTPRARTFDAKKPSGWAVQLGAYDTLGIAKEKWAMMSRSSAMLKDFPASSQSVSVKGRSFYRLTVNGLTTRNEAMQLCAALQSKGQGCFVRSMNATEKVQWASKPSVKLALR